MLRGTKTKQKTYAVLNARPTLQNQISALRSQVAKQKPETQYFRATGTHTSAAGTVETTHYNLTQSLISSITFRDNVTGDRWTNLALKMKFLLSASTIAQRVVLYVPRKAGSRFTPANPLVEQPDPTSFWIVGDYMLNKPDPSSDTLYSYQNSLKGLKTIYDSQLGNIDKGEVIVSVFSWCPSGQTAFQYGYELVFHNV